MKIRGVAGFRRGVHRVHSWCVPRTAILMYHRVSDLGTDPWGLSVTPSHFAEHLSVLRQRAHPMRLQELLGALRCGKLPRRAVVVTLDDGYADNLQYARPALSRHDIPATVFVTTGYVGSNREFWWDELDRLLLQPGTLPAELVLKVNGVGNRFELNGADQYSEEEYKRNCTWKVSQKHDPNPRHLLYRSLYQLLRSLLEKERIRVLDDLSTWAATDRMARPRHRILSSDEIVQLGAGGLVEVGAHTITHPVLSGLSVSEQRAEIQQSKVRLEELLGRPVTTFAYPYGSEADYSPATVDVVRETNFICACSTRPGAVTRRSDPFQLPRFIVGDWDGDTFAGRLSEWFDS